MESERFDRLARRLMNGHSRRGLLWRAATVPVAGLFVTLGLTPDPLLARDTRQRRRKRRKRRHQEPSCGEYRQPCCRNPLGEAVCRGTTLICAPATTTCVFCGYFTEPCCVSDNCVDGATCLNGRCEVCGDPGRPCCSGTTCRRGACVEGICR